MFVLAGLLGRAVACGLGDMALPKWAAHVACLGMVAHRIPGLPR